MKTECVRAAVCVGLGIFLTCISGCALIGIGLSLDILSCVGFFSSRTVID
jgi:hypothetical protein